MKRNKRTTILAHECLTPLTEKILARMGLEGKAIRRRLLLFYQERNSSKEHRTQEDRG